MDAVASVRELTEGVGVDYSFEAGGAKTAVLQAIEMTRPTGITFLIGVQKPGTMLESDAFTDPPISKKSIRSVYMGSANPQRDIRLYAELYLQGRFNLDDLVTHNIAFDEINEGLDTLKRGEIARTPLRLSRRHGDRPPGRAARMRRSERDSYLLLICQTGVANVGTTCRGEQRSAAQSERPDTGRREVLRTPPSSTTFDVMRRPSCRSIHPSP